MRWADALVRTAPLAGGGTRFTVLAGNGAFRRGDVLEARR
jgi:hypothetical protein